MFIIPAIGGSNLLKEFLACLRWTLLSQASDCDVLIARVTGLRNKDDRSYNHAKGPSIKYVTLEGEGGPRRCDGL